MKLRKAARARWIGTSVGTDTTWAPTISLSLQPKPFAGPYLSISVLGAASTVLWQVRQAASRIWIGRAI